MKHLTTIKTNKLYFFIMLFLDFLFILTLANVAFFYLTPASESAITLMDSMQDRMASASLSELANFDETLSADTEFMSAYYGLLASIGTFLLMSFLAWLFIKSFAWFFSHRSFMKKIPFLSYFQKFTLLSLFWFILIIAGVFLTSMAKSLFLGFGSILFWIYLLILSYFASISFSLIPATKTFKNTFVYGVTRLKKIGVAFIINVVLIIASLYIIAQVAKLSMLGGFIVLLLLLPVFVFTRFSIIIASWQKRL